FLVLLFCLPWFIWLYLNNKAKSNNVPRVKAYNAYNAATFYLNQLGIKRDNQSPQQFAETTDKHFGTNFNQFTNVYQKIKYSKTPLLTKETALVENFYSPFISQVKNNIPFKKRFSSFLNIYNTLHFFTKTKTT
ncbi:MAG TPA: hypothetical protein VF623_13955, partial [Segetibacter sp.]